MKSSTNLNIRIDKNMEEQAELIFDNLGLNMSTAINIFKTSNQSKWFTI